MIAYILLTHPIRWAHSTAREYNLSPSGLHWVDTNSFHRTRPFRCNFNLERCSRGKFRYRWTCTIRIKEIIGPNFVRMELPGEALVLISRSLKQVTLRVVPGSGHMSSSKTSYSHRVSTLYAGVALKRHGDPGNHGMTTLELRSVEIGITCLPPSNTRHHRQWQRMVRAMK